MPLLKTHEPDATLVLVGWWGRLRQQWLRMSLSLQFLVAAGLVVSLSMIGLATWASERIQTSATRSASEAGAIFLQAFLQPYVQDTVGSGPLSPEVVATLDGLLLSDPTRPFMMVKIWRLDSTLLYASNPNVKQNEGVEAEIRTAASGELARHFEELDEEVNGIAPEDNVTLLEVYAPLYRTGTNEIIAVGEFYQSAAGLIAEQHQTAALTWAAVAISTVSMLGILFMIVSRGSQTIDRQRRRLERQYVEANALANQNSRLRRLAERAREDASEANEKFLSRIGSELHDGPIQTLSLMMLSLQYGRDGTEDDDASDPPSGPPSTIRLARALYRELREISVGLILPEIEKATPAEVFEIAVSRFESMTGSSVVLDLKQMPEQLTKVVKICSYRIVQEALSNGHRHAGGVGQRVYAGAADGRLRIVITDDGPGFDTARASKPGDRHLGLIGMQNRAKSLKGKLTVRSRPGGGTRVWAVLPIEPATSDDF